MNKSVCSGNDFINTTCIKKFDGLSKQMDDLEGKHNLFKNDFITMKGNIKEVREDVKKLVYKFVDSNKSLGVLEGSFSIWFKIFVYISPFIGPALLLLMLKAKVLSWG